MKNEGGTVIRSFNASCFGGCDETQVVVLSIHSAIHSSTNN